MPDRFVVAGFDGTDPILVPVEVPIGEDGPYFEGRLGPFNIISSDSARTLSRADGVCTAGTKLSFTESSSISSDLLSASRDEWAAVCGDLTATVTGDSEGLTWGRFLFSGTPTVIIDAPRDRLELTTIEGKPAVVAHPRKDILSGMALVAVIEEMPQNGHLGVVTWVDHAISALGGLEAAQDLATSLVTEREGS